MESNREEARTSGVLSSLRRTWIAVALAVLAVLPVTVWTALALVRDVFPECRGALRAEGAEAVERARAGGRDLARVPLGEPATAYAHLARRYAEERDRWGQPAYRNVRLVRLDCGVLGEPAAECGQIPLPWTGRGDLDAPAVRVDYDRTRDWYVVVDASGSSSWSEHGDVLLVFRATSSPVRHFQRDRLFAGRHVPALVAFLALGALAVAALRSRRAIAYASRLHAWTESTLTREGMVQDEGGVTLATVESGAARRVPPGPVLVDPEAFAKGSVYRELPIVHRPQSPPARTRAGARARSCACGTRASCRRSASPAPPSRSGRACSAAERGQFGSSSPRSCSCVNA